MNQLKYEVYYARDQATFYLGQIKAAQKHSKLAKHFVTDYRFFFCFCSPIHFSANELIEQAQFIHFIQ